MVSQLDKIEIEDKRRKTYKQYNSIVSNNEESKQPFED